MLTTLALFALFTIGSADGGCAVDGATHCTVGTEVGTCNSSGTCGGFVALCTNLEKGDYCGNGGTAQGKCAATGTGKCVSVEKACTAASGPCRSTSNIIGNCGGSSPNFSCTDVTGCSTSGANCQDDSGNMKGKCDAASKCKYTETVTIQYTVRADKSTENASFPITKALIGKNDTDVKCDADEEHGTVEDSTSIDCPVTRGTDCVVDCKDTFSNVGLTRMCNNDGRFEGTLGTCVESCPVEADDTLNHRTGVFERPLTAIHGKIVCESVLHDAKCKLKCDEDYRVTTETAYKCDFDSNKPNKWNKNGTQGVCGESVDVFASTTLVLGPTDKYNEITNLTDTEFNKKFRDIIAGLDGVIEQNVTITAISPAPGSGRRLSETTVKVDYTVQAAKDDPDVRLLIGAPLRGIR